MSLDAAKITIGTDGLGVVEEIGAHLQVLPTHPAAAPAAEYSTIGLSFVHRLEVQRMIDASLISWQPNALNYQKLIDDALRVAFLERTKSTEGQSEKRADNALRERVTKLGRDVDSLAEDAKLAKSAAGRLHILEEELKNKNNQIAKLEQELAKNQHEWQAKLLASENRFKAALALERSKRLALFNRWAQRHGQDIELLRKSLEEGLCHLDSKASQEWQVQARCLDELRDKLDVALIRRLGYLPAVTNLPDTGTGTGSYGTLLGDSIRRTRDVAAGGKAGQGASTGNKGVRSIFSRNLSPPPSPASNSDSDSGRVSPSPAVPAASPSSPLSRSAPPSHTRNGASRR
jgi:hypothetical protein